jgi:hypothetical protein
MVSSILKRIPRLIVLALLTASGCGGGCIGGDSSGTSSEVSDLKKDKVKGKAGKANKVGTSSTNQGHTIKSLNEPWEVHEWSTPASSPRKFFPSPRPVGP